MKLCMSFCGFSTHKKNKKILLSDENTLQLFLQMNMDLQNIFPILFNLGPSSYPKIENSKKFILLSRVNSLVPTYARNLTELTMRLFSRRFLQFYDRLHEATVVTAFTCLAKLQAVTSFTNAVQGGSVNGPLSQGRIHEIRDVNAAFVSVASVKRSRVYP